jgi:addiction module RelE/StbE family toxin
MKVRWTEPAVNQLHHIFAYIASDNARAAYRTVGRIRETILRMARMPHGGRVGRIAGTREVSVPGISYLVAYRIVDQIVDPSVHVLAIFHGSQQWPESL